VNDKDFKKEVIRFSGLKTELSENLMNDFVAPLERNDIYKLSFCLSEELWQVINLFDFITLADINPLDFIGQIGDLFNKQNIVFDLLENTKYPQKTLKSVSENLLFCNKVRKQVLNEVKNLLQSAKQPLIRYSLCCYFLELLRALETTFCEIERVIINNN
jgi:hypothetical protein